MVHGLEQHWAGAGSTTPLRAPGGSRHSSGALMLVMESHDQAHTEDVGRQREEMGNSA